MVFSSPVRSKIAEKRGRFFLLYEVIFPIGLMFAGMIGFFLVPVYGWKAMFIVGLIPSVLTIPLRWFMPESPRWLASKGRIAEADAVVKLLEDDARRTGAMLREPVVRPIDPQAASRSDWRELFKGIYLKRTLMIWGLWVCAYMINNGLVTWLPTLYKQVFQLPLQTALAYGWITSGVGVIASIICALMIDKVGFDPSTSVISSERIVVRDGGVRRANYRIRLYTFAELRALLESVGFGEVRPGIEPDAENRLVVVADRPPS